MKQTLISSSISINRQSLARRLVRRSLGEDGSHAKKATLSLLIFMTLLTFAYVASAASISLGGFWSLALKSDWTVAAWGANGAGQLGDGTSGYTNDYFYYGSSVPVQAIGLSEMTAVAADGCHSLALKSDGTVWAWGDNEYGQVGDGTDGPGNEFKVFPVQVLGISGIKAIDGGGGHSLALKSDGALWAWGDNPYGQLGDGTTTMRNTPVQVSGLDGVIAIAGGEYHSLALKSDGTVWAWGRNYYGQLGDGTETSRLLPVQVVGLTGVVAIASGYRHSLAVKSDGTVWTWGSNEYGQLGNGEYETTYSPLPIQAIGLSNVIAVAGGCLSSLALKNDRTVWRWGGCGTYYYIYTPELFSDLSDVIAIACGSAHFAAVRNDGTVWLWGYNEYGQLGNGTTTFSYTPVQVSGLYVATCEASPFGGSGYSPAKGDFDGDGKADETVYDESSGSWFVELSSTRETCYQALGGSGYVPASADFDGDAKSDLTVYHEASGWWYVILSGSDYSLSYLKFGASGYSPVPGDFDGDGKDDIAVYEESSGYWWMLLSGSGYSISYLKFGASGYSPVPGDYDGDGKTDVAVYQESTPQDAGQGGYWYIFNTSTYTLSYLQFGASGYEPVIGDYDGDGKTDLAVYETSTAYWYIFMSGSYSLSYQKFGEPGYTPMPADYDGDGKADLASYDESTGYWYIQPSSNY